MQDRISASHQTRYGVGKPAVGYVVEVYYGYHHAWVDATWDGAQWRAADGTILTDITHWRVKTR